MIDKDYYNIKKNNLKYDLNIKEGKTNYIKEINNKYLKTTSFSDLFSYKSPKNKYDTLSNQQSQLVRFLEQYMAQKKISIDELRKLVTSQSPTRLKLDVKTILDVQDALDYIARKQLRQYGQSPSVPSQPTQPSVSQSNQTTSVQRPQGSSYNANNMWSPVSSAGTVYEWNRGVIGISYDGMIEIEKLDGTYNHHADATVRVSNLLGANMKMIDMPFQAGLDAKEQGILILQSEGDNCFVYFPDNITKAQQVELVKAITPRSNFTYSFVHKDEIFEDQQAQDVISYVTTLVNQLTQQNSNTR